MKRSLSPDSEQKILDVVTKVADAVVDGEDPNDAIVKFATDADLPPGHVGLVVRAYNIGRTNAQRETSSDVFEKSAEFPMADAATILAKMFPEDVKSGKEIKQANAVSAEYSAPPYWYKHLKEDNQLAKTAAAEPVKLTDKKVDYPVDHDRAYKQALYRAELRKTAVDEARRQCSAAQDKLHRTFEKLAEYFDTVGNLRFPDVRENVEILYGKEGLAVMNQVERMSPHLKKQASRDSFHRVTPQAKPYNLVKQAIEQVNEFFKRAHILNSLSKKAELLDEVELHPFASQKEPRVKSAMTGLYSETSLTKEAISPIEALFGLTIVKDMFGKLKPPSREELIESQLDQIALPQHEQELKNIHTQAVVQSLLANDPVLRGHDPAVVSSVFNDLNELSPRLSSQPMALQALLRQQVEQGSPAPFDVDQILRMEGQMRNNVTPEKVTHPRGNNATY